MEIKVEFDTASESARVQAAIAKVQKKLDAQVLKDSNYYCPMDTGVLQKSAIISSVLGSGQLVWNTPYASEQYFDKPNKSHQKNPNATRLWFEVAKSKNQSNWERLVNDEYIKNYQ